MGASRSASGTSRPLAAFPGQPAEGAWPPWVERHDRSLSGPCTLASLWGRRQGLWRGTQPRSAQGASWSGLSQDRALSVHLRGMRRLGPQILSGLHPEALSSVLILTPLLWESASRRCLLLCYTLLGSVRASVDTGIIYTPEIRTLWAAIESVFPARITCTLCTYKCIGTLYTPYMCIVYEGLFSA